jgi:hypothetical protein
MGKTKIIRTLFYNETPDAKTIEYYSVFWVGGTLAFIKKWLKNGMDSPVSDMAKMLAVLMGGRG